MIKKRSGFLMLELMLVIGVIVAFMGFYYTKIYIPQQKAIMVKEDVKNQEMIKKIINQYIKVVASYNKSLYENGIVDKDSFVELEPRSGIPNDKISFQLNKIVIDTNPFLNKDLVQAKCVKTSEDGEYYNYQCVSVGEDMTILSVEKTNLKFNDIYSNNIPIFKLMKLTKGNLVGTREFTYMETYSMFKEKSIKKLEILKKRMESFNKVVYVNEIGSPCSFDGGLDSWDDFNIPWIWKIHGETNVQSTMCEASQQEKDEQKIVCSCKNFGDSMWATEVALVTLGGNEALEAYNRVLSNLSLPRSYRYDEVGNPISIIIFSDVEQNAPTALAIDQAPPAPSENYSVDPVRTINEYKQGELYVKPANSNNAADYLEDSRVMFYYD